MDHSQLYWKNWRKRLRVWGLPCNTPTDPCTAGPRRPPQMHIQQGPGWAELTNIRIFVSLDDLRKLKVPCYDGHLREGRGRREAQQPQTRLPWAPAAPSRTPVWGLPQLGAPGSDAVPCLNSPPQPAWDRGVSWDMRLSELKLGRAGHSACSLKGPSTHHLFCLSHGPPLPYSCHPLCSVPPPLHLVIQKALHCCLCPLD